MQISKINSNNINFKAGAPVPYPEYTGRNSYGTLELDPYSKDPFTAFADSIVKLWRLFTPKVNRDSQVIKQSIDNLFDQAPELVGQNLNKVA